MEIIEKISPIMKVIKNYKLLLFVFIFEMVKIFCLIYFEYLYSYNKLIFIIKIFK